MSFCSFLGNSICICIDSDIEKERERLREREREREKERKKIENMKMSEKGIVEPHATTVTDQSSSEKKLETFVTIFLSPDQSWLLYHN